MPAKCVCCTRNRPPNRSAMIRGNSSLMQRQSSPIFDPPNDDVSQMFHKLQIIIYKSRFTIQQIEIQASSARLAASVRRPYEFRANSVLECLNCGRVSATDAVKGGCKLLFELQNPASRAILIVKGGSGPRSLQEALLLPKDRNS